MPLQNKLRVCPAVLMWGKPPSSDSGAEVGVQAPDGHGIGDAGERGQSEGAGTGLRCGRGLGRVRPGRLVEQGDQHLHQGLGRGSRREGAGGSRTAREGGIKTVRRGAVCPSSARRAVLKAGTSESTGRRAKAVRRGTVRPSSARRAVLKAGASESAGRRAEAVRRDSICPSSARGAALEAGASESAGKRAEAVWRGSVCPSPARGAVLKV